MTPYLDLNSDASIISLDIIDFRLVDINTVFSLASPPPSPNYGSRHSPNVMKTLTNMKRSFEESRQEAEEEEKRTVTNTVSSGIESEVVSTTESEPPHKFYIGEDMASGEKVFRNMNPSPILTLNP